MNKLGSLFSMAIIVVFLVACHKTPISTQPESQSASSSQDEKVLSKATPVSTPHYSLTLPEDWVVLYGPVKERGTTRFQLADKAKTSTISITVGPSQPGDADEIAQRIATRLQTKAEHQNGQWQCIFKHEKASGYTIIREDPNNALLLVLTASGDIQKTDFIFQMRSPYIELLPKKP